MSNKPIFLDELIDRASKAAGNDSELARQIGTRRQAVNDWKHGRLTCPAADVALMAHIAGLDAEAWGARALIAQHEGTEKGKLLQQALKKALLATGAALGSCGVNAQALIDQCGTALSTYWLDFIRCILCYTLRGQN